jgi:hypothetical protein
MSLEEGAEEEDVFTQIPVEADESMDLFAEHEEDAEDVEALPQSSEDGSEVGNMEQGTLEDQLMELRADLVRLLRRFDRFGRRLLDHNKV